MVRWTLIIVQNPYSFFPGGVGGSGGEATAQGIGGTGGTGEGPTVKIDSVETLHMNDQYVGSMRLSFTHARVS
jgi:hypothetical protein